MIICLSLTAHIRDVETIATKAEKDVKVESAIKNFEEVWLSKLFDLTEYQQTFAMTRSEVCVCVCLRACVCVCVCACVWFAL